MKAIHIVPSLHAKHGGPSKSVLGLAKAIADAGVETELLSTEAGAGWSATEGSLQIRVFRRDRPNSICPSSGLRDYLARARADIFHHHSIWLRTLHYAHRAARTARAPLVISPRGMMDPWAWRHHSRRKVLARVFIHPGAFEAAAGWHATSDAEASEIRKLGFGQPVCTAPNGLADPGDTAGAAEYWNELVPNARSKRIALFYSRLHQKKRVIELIDTWLAHAPADWLLLIVGIPEQYSAKAINDYVVRAGGSGRVRAFDGSDKPAPYPAASLFLLPSHGENFGLSIGEALANGLPVLVTDSTPWSRVNELGAGWCVPWGQFANALVAATSEGTDKLKERGRTGRRWVLEQFSWETSARRLIEFYGGLKGQV